ncbi:MAG: hypothetical protein P8Y60_08920 [Calditrichota bacterium]
MSEWKEIKAKIIKCLQRLYHDDSELFKRNKGRGISERCLNFRFAHYLQIAFKNDYFVDCDFNSFKLNEIGQSQKQIPNPDGRPIGRYIDILIHKRDKYQINNIACFEMKKWNNRENQGIEKDINNLKYLTRSDGLGYSYGFHVIYGKCLETTKIQVFENGQKVPIQVWQDFNDE